MRLSEREVLERRIWRHFGEGCKRYGLLEDGDCIMVAVSGGKDSLALLDLLSRRARVWRPRIELRAVHVVMDGAGYESDLGALRAFAGERDVELEVVRAEFEEGVKSPCFRCSRARRKALFGAAVGRGCNKLALGHHQDDVLTTLLMNLIYEGRFATMPARLELRRFPLTVVRPLCMVREADLGAWAGVCGYPRQVSRCRYEGLSRREDARRLLTLMEGVSGEARFSLWHALDVGGKLVERRGEE